MTQWNIWGLDNVGKINADTTRNYYLRDHLSSIRVVLNSSNAVISAQDYDAWGYPLENRTYNSTAMKYDFTAKERDNETSYDYFGARYYDSRIGRWGGVEPKFNKYIEFSPYCYSFNNPIFFTDINGKDAIYIYYLKYRIDVGGKRVPGIGHAGVLLIDNKSGEAVYYDYGRYGKDSKGIVRKTELGKVTIDKEGKLDENSISDKLKQVSEERGKGSQIEGAYIESDKFKEMKEYAENQYDQTNNENSEDEYSLLTNNCSTFASDVIGQDDDVFKAPGPPFLELPRSYVGWYRVWNKNVDYNDETASYKIGN